MKQVSQAKELLFQFLDNNEEHYKIKLASYGTDGQLFTMDVSVKFKVT